MEEASCSGVLSLPRLIRWQSRLRGQASLPPASPPLWPGHCLPKANCHCSVFSARNCAGPEGPGVGNSAGQRPHGAGGPGAAEGIRSCKYRPSSFPRVCLLLTLSLRPRKTSLMLEISSQEQRPTQHRPLGHGPGEGQLPSQDPPADALPHALRFVCPFHCAPCVALLVTLFFLAALP